MNQAQEVAQRLGLRRQGSLAQWYLKPLASLAINSRQKIPLQNQPLKIKLAGLHKI